MQLHPVAEQAISLFVIIFPNISFFLLLHIPLMLSPSPGRTKATFGAELRKRETEFSHLAQQNFDLRLQVSNLTEQLNRITLPRSPSSSPVVDDFYQFDDGQPQDAPPPNPAPPLEDYNPIIRELRVEVADLRQENEELMEKKDQLNDVLDDLREKAIAEREEAQEKFKAQQAEMQTLANQGEDLQSANLQLRIQVSQAKEQVENMRVETDNAKIAVEECERRERALRTRNTGWQMQYDAAVAAMEEEKRRAQEASEKVGEGNAEILGLRKRLEDKAVEVDELRREVTEVSREREVVKEVLEREKERAGIWEETGKLMEQGQKLLHGGPAMKDLMAVLQRQRERYDQTQYHPRWREMIVADLNECLRVLYRSQREVEAKRQLVIEQFCGGNLAQEGMTTTSAS